MNVSGGDTSRTPEALALRQLPPMEQKVFDAITTALDDIRADTINGTAKLTMIDLVFWKRTHTLDGAAQKLYVSYRTILRWHNRFIKSVARNMGYDV